MGGRKLVAPDDARVRPTSDRTRQAMFNMLLHKDFGIGFALEGAAVLDLFAGCGPQGAGVPHHEPGASRAVLVGPAIHELILDELRPAIEQVEQAQPPARSRARSRRPQTGSWRPAGTRPPR